MVRYRKWVLTLGIMAVAPGIVMGGQKFPFFKSKAERSATAAVSGVSGAQLRNQQVAESVATAMRTAGLSNNNIEIEFRNGVVKLDGTVTDAIHKAKATKVASQVSGVRRVDNRLTALSWPRTPQSNPVQLAAAFGRKRPAQTYAIRQASAELPASTPGNQEMAEQIAAALSSARLTGYDIEIRYDQGTVVLAGNVGNQGQWKTATEVVSAIPGVENVLNQMTVNGARQQPMSPNPYAAAQYPYMPAGYQAAPGQPAVSGAGMSAPPNWGHPGSGASHTVYNSPNVPGHAWPSYAAYPNYAQVAYPKQYSASAWPYIGPFYPYPQVPLGWRDVRLQWDDGYWNLNFNSRTDKWWWFVNPKNW